jgi:hypothetical protein
MFSALEDGFIYSLASTTPCVYPWFLRWGWIHSHPCPCGLVSLTQPDGKQTSRAVFGSCPNNATCVISGTLGHKTALPVLGTLCSSHFHILPREGASLFGLIGGFRKVTSVQIHLFQRCCLLGLTLFIIEDQTSTEGFWLHPLPAGKNTNECFPCASSGVYSVKHSCSCLLIGVETMSVPSWRVTHRTLTHIAKNPQSQSLAW